MTVVLVGNIIDGLTIYGPFETDELARDWAEHECSGIEWIIATTFAVTDYGD